MKRFALGLTAATLLAANNAAAVTTVLSEGFEGAASYTTSIAQFTDNAGDFFTVSDGSNIGNFTDFNTGEPGNFYSVTGFSGSNFFAVMDINGEQAETTATMSFEDIAIAGLTGLEFSILLAEDAVTDASQDWDADTSFLIEYSIDNGDFVKLLAVEAEGGTNTTPKIDTDFDGLGDGAALTPTFTEYSATIVGTGSSLDLRLTFANLTAGDEDISIDDIIVTAVPEPSSLALLGLGGLLIARRRRG